LLVTSIDLYYNARIHEHQLDSLRNADAARLELRNRKWICVFYSDYFHAVWEIVYLLQRKLLANLRVRNFPSNGRWTIW